MSNYVDAAFTKKHLQDGKTKVINVLARDKYAEKHIPGSINIPEDSPDFVPKVEQFIPDKSTPVIVHCSNMDCQASTKAARKLESLGYKEVYDFKAGLQGWQDAGNEFETPGKPTRAERPPRPGREKSVHQEPQTPETPPL